MIMTVAAIAMITIIIFKSGNSPLIPKYSRNPVAAYPNAHNGHICLMNTTL